MREKQKGLLVITAVYIAAFIIGAIPYYRIDDMLAASAVFTAVATVVVFISSCVFSDVSMYDPYWSVQPVVIVLCFALSSKMTTAALLILVSVTYWGIRLTANWAYTFGGLGIQDWRYTKYRNETGKLYPFVNFTGIHMMPTLIVYLCTLPAVFVTTSEVNANIGSMAGTAVCVGAATLQLFADVQMHKYRKSGRKGLIRTGLWKNSRHPNYLGEILMWWGIAVQAVSVMPERWWLIAGAVANTVMFFTVSIPLADKRQSQKPGYEEYRAETRSLLPIPK